MKTPDFLLVVTFILVMLQTSQSVYAQDTFAAKKKKNYPVNTSSLQAVRMNRLVAKKVGRITSPATGRSIPFPKPFIRQGTPNVLFSEETGLPSFITTARDNRTGRTRRPSKRNLTF